MGRQKRTLVYQPQQMAQTPPTTTHPSPALLGRTNRPALDQWALRNVAEYCTLNPDKLPTDLPAGDDKDAKAARKKQMSPVVTAARKASLKPADYGTYVHQVVEWVHRHGQFPPGGGGAEGSDRWAAYESGANYLDQLEAQGIRALYVEVPVYSQPGPYQYAGTADMIGVIAAGSPLNPGPKDVPVLVDVKTGASGIWETDALQVAAYSAAHTYVNPKHGPAPLPAYQFGCDSASATGEAGHLVYGGCGCVVASVGEDCGWGDGGGDGWPGWVGLRCGL